MSQELDLNKLEQTIRPEIVRADFHFARNEKMVKCDEKNVSDNKNSPGLFKSFFPSFYRPLGNNWMPFGEQSDNFGYKKPFPERNNFIYIHLKHFPINFIQIEMIFTRFLIENYDLQRELRRGTLVLLPTLSTDVNLC